MSRDRILAGSILVAVAILFAWSSIARKPTPNPALPEGCDDFGYLNMAQALDEGVWLSDHARRPFHNDLVEHLEAQGAKLPEYAWMVAPHAYHVDSKTGRVINQYPPATSLSLTLLPLEVRSVLAPGLFALLCMLPLALGFQIVGPRPPLVAAAWAIATTAAVLWLDPPARLAGGMGSYGPTLGLLVTAGWLIRSHPVAALALVSATIPFRLGNGLLLAALFLVVLTHAPWPTGWRGFALRVLRGGLAALFGGLVVYLLYATVLLGAPWAFTYSPIDREWADLSTAWSNLASYLDPTKPWLRFHVGGLVILAGQAWREKSARWFLAGLFLAVTNYLFFVLHNVRIDAYPYASGMLILGLALRGLAEARFPGPKAITGVAAAAVGWAAMNLGTIDLDHARVTFESERNLYREAFSDFDVVWGEHRTGTVEYATRGAAFRYNWGPAEVRSDTMQWLQARGLRQAVWAGDIGMPTNVAGELESAGVSFRANKHPILGEILIVPPPSPRILSDERPSTVRSGTQPVEP
ncbi:MAG: hypothetical protein JRG83_09435 [Deltaproteobacteria bacterium]|nr:hypothetical protein [Deltaproteobacteria bacterium]